MLRNCKLQDASNVSDTIKSRISKGRGFLDAGKARWISECTTDIVHILCENDNLAAKVLYWSIDWGGSSQKYDRLQLCCPNFDWVVFEKSQREEGDFRASYCVA